MMASKPPKLIVTVSGPLDSGKTHLLIKLQEFLKETYGTDIKVKADALTLSRYDGHEHGPARPHRGSEIELRSETVSDINLVIDPEQPGVIPELVIHSKEHRLTVYRDSQRVYSVQGVARMLVPNVQLLPSAAREWAINALAGTTATVVTNPYRNRVGFIHNDIEHLSMETSTRDVYRWSTKQRVSLEDLNGAAYAWARLFGGEQRKPRKYVGSDKYDLSMSLPRCTLVDSRTGALVKDWGTLTEGAFDWALQVMRENDCHVMADLHEFKRRPWLIGLVTPPIPDEEQPVSKFLKPRESLLSRLKGFLFGYPPAIRTVDELKVTTNEEPTTSQESFGHAFIENVSEPRRVSTGIEHRPSAEIRAEHYARASKRPAGAPVPRYEIDSFNLKPTPLAEEAQRTLDGIKELEGRMYASMALTPDQLKGHAQAQGLTLPPPVEVDDFTLTLDTRIEDARLLENHCITTPDDAGLVADERLQDRYAKVEGTWVPAPDGKLKDGVSEEEADAYLALHYPESQRAHEVEAATQEVIDRLGGIVPHHHGHARKVMPLEGPTGKKSNFNVRNQKAHGKKKPRR
jgi:hypothetical protein